MKNSILYITCLVCLCLACSANKDPEKNPPLYNLSKPEKFSLPESLLEISGISLKNGNTDTIYAIQDEEGKLFKLEWGKRKPTHAKFGKQGDYEDLTILGDDIFILKSNGVIYRFRLEEARYVEIDDAIEIKDLLPKGEYESIYGDTTTGRLMLLCKNCAQDKGNDMITGYILSISPTMTIEKTFRIETSGLDPYFGKVKYGLRVSALAKNPIDGNWYLLSAVNRLLVIMDANWQLIDAYPLNGNMFNQPEGIAFDNNGNMYISNEGDELTDGNILRFKKLNKR